MRSLYVKVASFLLAMLILSVVTFYIARLAPGDPLQSFYGERVEQMSTEEHEAARHRLGLDAPLYVQYGHWIENLAHGDCGISFKYKEPADEVIGSFIGNTLLLGIVSYVLVFILAIGIGLICTFYEDQWVDFVLCKLGTIGYYLPPFWLGLVLILIFNVNLHWLPGSGAYDPGMSGNVMNRLEHMILPLIIMVGSHVWYYAYMVRNKLLDEVRQEYVLLAKTKGLSRLNVLIRHCLRNTVPTIVNIMAISVNHILGGTYVVEAVFSYPGLGALSIESAKYHDYNLLMLIVLLTGSFVIVSGLLAQTVNEWFDPRTAMQRGGTLWNLYKREVH